jgi:hypothetical protein
MSSKIRSGDSSVTDNLDRQKALLRSRGCGGSQAIPEHNLLPSIPSLRCSYVDISRSCDNPFISFIEALVCTVRSKEAYAIQKGVCFMI